MKKVPSRTLSQKHLTKGADTRREGEPSLFVCRFLKGAGKLFFKKVSLLFPSSICRNFASVFVRNAQKRGLLLIEIYKAKTSPKMQIQFTFLEKSEFLEKNKENFSQKSANFD